MNQTILQVNNPSMFQIREFFQKLVLDSLYGPMNGDTEVLSEISPRTKYILGSIAPKNQPFEPEENDKISTDSEDSPEDGMDGLILDMKKLSELPKEELIQTLNILPDAYQLWITKQYSKIDKPDEFLEPYKDVSVLTLKNCENSKQRILEGIQLLEQDDNVLEAFQFANRAVYLQRVRSTYHKALLKDPKCKLSDFDIEKNRTWRLFQLGFILLNLPSIANLKHKDRSHETNAIADLLWFPTGGGKTEAYLGLRIY